MSTPVAVRWLTYPGDQTSAIGQVMGPTTMREHVTVAEATYDPDTHTTRLGFAYGTHTIDKERAA